MSITITMVDEQDKKIANYGYINWEDTHSLIELTNSLNMKCLSFIDIAGNVTFNQSQLEQIKREIQQLRETQKISEEVLAILTKAVNDALEKHQFLKFEGE